MNCDRTYSETIIDLTQTGHPRSVHAAVLRYVRGIRNLRKIGVSRLRVRTWLAVTPDAAIDAALADLITEGKIAQDASKRYKLVQA
jgi:hypothetical protein